MCVLFVELFVNVCNDVFDVVVVSVIVDEVVVLLIVDNMFVILFLFWLIEYGVVVVVYFVLKFFVGYGFVFGGVIVDDGCFDVECVGYNVLYFVLLGRGGVFSVFF